MDENIDEEDDMPIVASLREEAEDQPGAVAYTSRWEEPVAVLLYTLSSTMST